MNPSSADIARTVLQTSAREIFGLIHCALTAAPPEERLPVEEWTVAVRREDGRMLVRRREKSARLLPSTAELVRPAAPGCFWLGVTDGGAVVAPEE